MSVRALLRTALRGGGAVTRMPDLADLDRRIAAEPDRPLSHWFSGLSPEVYLDLYTMDLHDYPALARRLPMMPPVESQRRWNGADGETLRRETLAFMRILRAGYERHIGDPLADARVLDYGAGWGRLTRMLLQIVPEERVDAVDALASSVDLFNGLGFRRPARVVEAKPRRPVEGSYDLVVLYSVLTHLPLDHVLAIMRSLRPAAHGLTVVTIRPPQLWRRQGEDALLIEHEATGFAHRASGPHWGDTTMTAEFLEAALPDWSLLEVENSLRPWLQTVVYLR